MIMRVSVIVINEPKTTQSQNLVFDNIPSEDLKLEPSVAIKMPVMNHTERIQKWSLANSKFRWV